MRHALRDTCLSNNMQRLNQSSKRSSAQVLSQDTRHLRLLAIFYTQTSITLLERLELTTKNQTTETEEDFPMTDEEGDARNYKRCIDSGCFPRNLHETLKPAALSTEFRQPQRLLANIWQDIKFAKTSLLAQFTKRVNLLAGRAVSLGPWPRLYCHLLPRSR